MSNYTRHIQKPLPFFDDGRVETTTKEILDGIEAAEYPYHRSETLRRVMGIWKRS